MNEYAAHLGIDWADKKHELCLVDAATEKKIRVVLTHTAGDRRVLHQPAPALSGTKDCRGFGAVARSLVVRAFAV
ncbi:MAG: hypothetical protein ABR568_03835 [Pyrinomonadaceae bacterium]